MSSPVSSVELRKTLGIFDLTALGIGAIVGAGIFSTVGEAVSHGGPAVSILFLVTAISCGLSALCYAQFASAMPNSGSAYTYAFSTFGKSIGWLVGWNLILEYAISNVAVALSWSDYFSAFIAGFGLSIPRIISIGSVTIQCNFAACLITLIITILCYIGIKESKNANNILVVFKLLIIATVIGIGFFYIQPENWHPFAPQGIHGVLYGVSSVFFAYIGFDAISTTAEECKNPQKDMPKAMFLSLGISTLIYILVTLTITGMVPYHLLGVGDPLAYIFEYVKLPALAGTISFISVITLSSVMLVYQLGQPRIWMSMSRDGLLPKAFSKIHPKYKTPSVSTIVMGFAVGVPALFADLKHVVDLTSIGTLFAFLLVCTGITFLEKKGQLPAGKFKIYYINTRWFAVVGSIGILTLCIKTPNLSHYIMEKPMFFLAIICSGIYIIWAAYYRLSLIPILGSITNLLLMAQLGIENWVRFIVWLCMGIIFYIVYQKIKKNKLNLVHT